MFDVGYRNEGKGEFGLVTGRGGDGIGMKQPAREQSMECKTPMEDRQARARNDAWLRADLGDWACVIAGIQYRHRGDVNERGKERRGEGYGYHDDNNDKTARTRHRYRYR